MLQSNKTRRNAWLCSLAYMVRIVNVLNNIYFSSNQERWLYLRPRQRMMFILSPPWVRRSMSRVKYVCSRYEYLLDHICRERTRLCVFRVHLGLWPHFLFLHAKTIWINTGRRSICIARYPKRQSVLGLFLACFFFLLLIVAEDSHMLCERINIFQPTDGLDAHAAGPIPSLVHPQTPHTFARSQGPARRRKQVWTYCIIFWIDLHDTVCQSWAGARFRRGGRAGNNNALSVEHCSPLPDIKMFVSRFCFYFNALETEAITMD